MAEPTAAQFERAVAGVKDDVGRLLVYADHLTERGDPLGALIVLQTTDREANPLLELELTTRVRQGLGVSSRDLHAVAFEWRWGFVDTLTLKGVRNGDNAALLATVLAAPACRFVRHLKVQLAHLDGAQGTDASWLSKVSQLARLDLLSRLTCTAGIRNFGSVRALVPRLEHLSLGIANLAPRKHFDLPLRSLELTGFGSELDRLLHQPPWTALTHLKVEREVASVNAVLERCPLTSLDVSGSPAMVEELCASPHLGKLRKLTLRRVNALQPLVARRADLGELSLHLVEGSPRREDVGTLKATLKQVTFVGLLGPTEEGGYSRPLRL